MFYETPPSPVLAPESSPSPMLAPEPFPSPMLAPSYALMLSIRPPVGLNTTSGCGSNDVSCFNKWTKRRGF
ncbi:hypothetical protein Tco_0637287 [Tanacetum coccineum]